MTLLKVIENSEVESESYSYSYSYMLDHFWILIILSDYSGVSDLRLCGISNNGLDCGGERMAMAKGN